MPITRFLTLLLAVLFLAGATVLGAAWIGGGIALSAAALSALSGVAMAATLLLLIRRKGVPGGNDNAP